MGDRISSASILSTDSSKCTVSFSVGFACAKTVFNALSHEISVRNSFILFTFLTLYPKIFNVISLDIVMLYDITLR